MNKIKSIRKDWKLIESLINHNAKLLDVGCGEGELIQTYTRMVAELIVCLYQELCEDTPEEQPVIHLTYAQVLLGKRIEGRDYYFSRNSISR